MRRSVPSTVAGRSVSTSVSTSVGTGRRATSVVHIATARLLGRLDDNAKVIDQIREQISDSCKTTGDGRIYALFAHEALAVKVVDGILSVLEHIWSQKDECQLQPGRQCGNLKSMRAESKRD